MCVCVNIHIYIIGGASGQGCNSALEDAVDIAQVLSSLALLVQKYKYGRALHPPAVARLGIRLALLVQKYLLHLVQKCKY